MALLYGPQLSQRLTLVAVLRDPEERSVRVPLLHELSHPLMTELHDPKQSNQSNNQTNGTKRNHGRAWSWFRFFALNAQDEKAWARDQLSYDHWFHYSDGSFRRWTVAQIAKRTACKARGVPTSRMWPDCDSETGMFGGLYAAQSK